MPLPVQLGCQRDAGARATDGSACCTAVCDRVSDRGAGPTSISLHIGGRAMCKEMDVVGWGCDVLQRVQ